jgi:hypothetical protein
LEVIVSTEFTDRDWRIIVQRIQAGKCTPFLGAGVARDVLPLGSDIAKRWADEYEYPFEDKSNLMTVSQYIAVYYDKLFAKEELVRMFGEFNSPDLEDHLEPHNLLADFPLEVYITTNYDDFMARALKHSKRDVRRVLCQWNPLTEDYVAANPTDFDANPNFKPTVANPVVFHMHGYVPVAESLVLTEDDYIEFLFNMSGQRKLIPQRIEEKLITTSLLFIGYRLADWNFRVILQSLNRYNLNNFNVLVMPPPSTAKDDDQTKEELQKAQEQQRRTQEYLTKYYENIDVHVYWGTAKEFLQELKGRAG